MCFINSLQFLEIRGYNKINTLKKSPNTNTGNETKNSAWEDHYAINFNIFISPPTLYNMPVIMLTNDLNFLEFLMSSSWLH